MDTTSKITVIYDKFHDRYTFEVKVGRNILIDGAYISKELLSDVPEKLANELLGKLFRKYITWTPPV